MKPNRLYMHKDCMDVFIEIVKSYIIEKNRYNLKVKWWNLGYSQNPYVIDPNPPRIGIKNAQDWIDITNTVTNKRTKPGLP